MSSTHHLNTLTPRIYDATHICDELHAPPRIYAMSSTHHKTR